jgi:hypothetical protein
MHYTERDGGLWLPWRGVTFVNRPYHDVPRWLSKAATEFGSGRASLILGLISYRPETNGWKTTLRSGAAVFVLEHRLWFGGRTYISTSINAVIVWGLHCRATIKMKCARRSWRVPAGAPHLDCRAILHGFTIQSARRSTAATSSDYAHQHQLRGPQVCCNVDKSGNWIPRSRPEL